MKRIAALFLLLCLCLCACAKHEPVVAPQSTTEPQELDSPTEAGSPYSYKGAGNATEADLGAGYVEPTQAPASTPVPPTQSSKPLDPKVRDEVLPTPVPTVEPTPTPTPTPTTAPVPQTPAVDLSGLSTTMVYAELSNICSYPADYVGKCVKMAGTYTVATDAATGTVYHSCICKDATACCQMGLEFALASGSYPTDGSAITVMGTFQTYVENGCVYCQLVNATLC